jgi:hypothetical protein
LCSTYNYHHQHSGLALFTAADVFHDRVGELIITRQAGLDAAYAAHPERLVNGPPQVARPPAVVAINPLEPHTPLISADQLLECNTLHDSMQTMAT